MHVSFGGHPETELPVEDFFDRIDRRVPVPVFVPTPLGVIVIAPIESKNLGNRVPDEEPGLSRNQWATEPLRR